MNIAFFARRGAVTRRRLGLVLAWGLLLWTATAGAQATDAQAYSGDALAGQVKSRTEVCQECHGPDGNSAEPKFPRLAGQHAAYLVKQIRDFQSGARKHEVMNNMAAAISERDLRDIAAWFAGNALKKGDEARSESALGQRLYQSGDPARGIAACASCHGADGRGAVNPGLIVPSLAGQYRDYLRFQLLDWRIKARSNSPGGVMNQVAAALTGDEIRALADHIAGL